jgi:hypothetical protein
MSNFDLQFKYPVGWKLLATGKRTEQETKGTEEISRWVSERPIPLAGFNLGKYVSASAVSKAEGGGIVVESYATRALEKDFPELPKTAVIPPRPRDNRNPILEMPSPTTLDPARNVSMIAERSARTIDFLAWRLGPYPYSSLFLTQIPGPDSQGWPGLIFLSSHVFLTPAERAAGRGSNYMTSPEEMIYDRLMEAHETAHQWWGDAIFWQSYREQWLMEALANYSALLELESENPEQAKAILEFYRRGLETPAPGGSLPRKDAGPVSLGVRLNSSKSYRAYETVAYGRGTWLIHMLRSMLRDASLMKSGGQEGRTKRESARAQVSYGQSGSPTESDPDALFFTALRNTYKKFSGKVMSTQDLQLAFEEVLPKSLQFEGKRSLDWFFEGWVNGTAIPKFALDNVKLTPTPGKATLIARATLRQKDAPEVLVTSVPIYASTADGRLLLIDRVFADGQETAIKLTVPAGTKKLVIDPFQTVLTGN